MNSSTLRQIWTVIGQTQARVLLELCDSELIRQIQEQLETRVFLNESESNAVRYYIQSKVHLIRDLAESRMSNA